MGLDSVEIIVEVEKTFGIDIPDREAEKIITVGDFHNCVWQHLHARHSTGCVSQALFYSLRNSFADHFDIPKQTFRFDMAPDTIFPRVNRRLHYNNFAMAINLELPPLVLTKPWLTVLSIFGLTTIIGSLITVLILINFYDYTNWLLLAPVAGIALTILFSNMLNPMRIIVEPVSIKEFVRKVLHLNYAKLVGEKGTNRKDVEIVMNHIIADKAGLELEEITPEKKIHDDLGVD